jgi:hypothetical protein
MKFLNFSLLALAAFAASAATMGCAADGQDDSGTSEGNLVLEGEPMPPPLAWIEAGTFTLRDVEPDPFTGAVRATLKITGTGVATVTEDRTDCEIAIGLPGVPEDCTHQVRSYNIVASGGSCGVRVYTSFGATGNRSIKITDYRDATCADSVAPIVVEETRSGVTNTKYGTPEAPNYTCPAPGYLDCMPGKFVPAACDGDYLSWIEGHCPSVKVVW